LLLAAASSQESVHKAFAPIGYRLKVKLGLWHGGGDALRYGASCL